VARIARLKDGARRLGASAPMLRPADPRRDDPSRAWYKTAAWQRLRWDVLVRDRFTCRMCGWAHHLSREAGVLTAVGLGDLVTGRAPQLVADHIEAHRGDQTRFWDPANLQCLCRRCHDGPKQRAEGGRGWRGVV
jgi:5-methylcytosine-specific restriction enzyme A